MPKQKPTTPIELPSPLTASSSPMEVARCTALPVDARRTILDRWHDDAMAVERAAGEGMTGEGRSRLAEVSKALDALDEAPPTRTDA